MSEIWRLEAEYTAASMLGDITEAKEAEIIQLIIYKGVWNDTTIYYVFGQKPKDA